MEHADRGEDVMKIRQGAQQTGLEFSQFVTIECGPPPATRLEWIVTLQLKEHLALFIHIAQEIGAGGFALDETDLR